MYSGFSTSIGSIVGRVGGSSTLTELSDVIDSVGAEESLVCLDENNQDIHMSSMLNPQTGEVIWLPLENADFVKLKTMSMSQMSSMLRDDYRNGVYEEAIHKSIDAFRQFHQRNPIILDIGTGTGLLAMLCAKYGAEAVFAVEMFDLLAETAQENVNRNGMAEKIMIIQGRSSDIEGLPVAVDIIVSELLDSALLGECVIPSHADAIARFMDQSTLEGPDKYPLENRVIPHSAEMYATLVQSMEVQSMVSIHNILPNDLPGSEHSTIYRETEYSPNCAGGWGLFPVHWKQIVARSDAATTHIHKSSSSAQRAKLLSDAIPCMHAEFWHTNPQLTHKDNSGYAMFDTEIEVKESGMLHGILFHWKAHLLSLALDPGQQVTYSTDPSVLEQYPFQDHWKQCVYPLAQPIQVYPGQILSLRVCHDDLRVWAFVTVSPNSPPPPPASIHANTNTGNFCGDASLVSTAMASGMLNHHNTKNMAINDDTTESVLGKKRNRRLQEVKRSLSCMVSKEFQEAYAMPPCSCGWHLLHDNHTTSYWNDMTQKKQIQPLVRHVSQQILTLFTSKFVDPVSGLLRLQTLSGALSVDALETIQEEATLRILDDSDGSLFSLLVAQTLKHLLHPFVEKAHAFAQAAGLALDGYLLPSIVLTSVEKRQFSRMFYLHLMNANDLLLVENNEDMEDGPTSTLQLPQQQIVHVEVVESVYTSSESATEDTMDADDQEKTAKQLKQKDYDVSLALTGRRQYTLNALPLWQALSFLYSTRALYMKRLSENAGNSSTAMSVPRTLNITPFQAKIMMIPFQSNKLCRGHGPIHQPVRGLDHTAYDQQIMGSWSSFLYPYHVSEYSDMRFLTRAPFEVYSLSYEAVAAGQTEINYRRIPTQIPMTEEFLAVRSMMASTTGEFLEARIDGVIFYVDYVYSPEQVQASTSTSNTNQVVRISPWQPDVRNFAPYEVQSVKFFASSYPLHDNGHTQHEGHDGIKVLQVELALDNAEGDTSDFEMSFSFF